MADGHPTPVCESCGAVAPDPETLEADDWATQWVQTSRMVLPVELCPKCQDLDQRQRVAAELQERSSGWGILPDDDWQEQFEAWGAWKARYYAFRRSQATPLEHVEYEMQEHRAAMYAEFFKKAFAEVDRRLKLQEPDSDGLRYLPERERQAAVEQMMSDPEFRELAEGLGAFNRLRDLPDDDD